MTGQADVFGFFLIGPSSSPSLTLGLGLGFGFGFSSSSTSIASFSSSFFGLDLALGFVGFFLGSSSASLPSTWGFGFFLVCFFFPSFAAKANSRSPLASDAVTPPDPESLSLGEPSSLDEAWKSSSKRTPSSARISYVRVNSTNLLHCHPRLHQFEALVVRHHCSQRSASPHPSRRRQRPSSYLHRPPSRS